MSEFLRELRESRVLSVAALGLSGTLALTLAGCGNPEVTEGTVTQKVFTPEHNDTVYIPYCVGSKPRICVPVPLTVHHNDKYTLHIENCAIKPEDATECPSRNVDVTEQVYDQTKVGDHFVIPEQE